MTLGDVIYLSLYFKQHRSDYYALLDEVRREGDWEAWLTFFLDGVAQTAEGAVAAAQRLSSLFQQDQARIQQEGRVAGSALRVHEVLKQRPVMSLQETAQRTGLSFPAASSGMQVLERLGVARELTGRRRYRLFGYDQYLGILSEGTEV